MLTCMHMLMCMQIWVDYHKTKDCISAVMTVCSNTVKFYIIIPFLYSVGAVHWAGYQGSCCSNGSLAQTSSSLASYVIAWIVFISLCTLSLEMKDTSSSSQSSVVLAATSHLSSTTRLPTLSLSPLLPSPIQLQHLSIAFHRCTRPMLQFASLSPTTLTCNRVKVKLMYSANNSAPPHPSITLLL